MKSGYGSSTSSASRASIANIAPKVAAAKSTGVWSSESRPGPEQQAHRGQVVHAAAHQVAGAPAEEEGLRQALQVREEVVAQLVLDLARGVEDLRAREEAQRRARQSATASEPRAAVAISSRRQARRDRLTHQPTSIGHSDEAGGVAERRRDPDARSQRLRWRM